MTGAELLIYVKRRLGEDGLTVEAGYDDELYDYITEGRDWLVQDLALSAPVTVRQLVTLEEDGTDDRLWNFPSGTKDPLRSLVVRAVNTREPLTPAGTLDVDNGDYEWITPRQLRLAESVNPPGGVEGYFILQRAAIGAATTEDAVGLIVPFHRAIGKAAVVLALTADEESDARNAMGLLQRELDSLARIYGEYDARGGLALREALMQGIGQHLGDTLY